MKLEQLLAQYDYEFPESAIAQHPARPRDSAKLLIYNRATEEVCEDTFLNLDKYLPEEAVLVLNNTKVLPARFEVSKPTGGLVRLLYIRAEAKNIFCLADRALDEGMELKVGRHSLRVVRRENNGWIIAPDFPVKDIEKFLEKNGRVPLPPYIKHFDKGVRVAMQEYQTVFAKKTGSVAAPTASLHFTAKLINKLKKKGIAIKYVTLHVGLGTFAPLTEEHIKTGRLHREEYSIDSATAKFLNAAKAAGHPIVAVGTTAVRTLESACDGGRLKKLSGQTQLFIRESKQFKFVDSIITNFHVPRSSLLMLVSAFVGREQILRMYKYAIERGFRLFSFGDGMLIR
jgi:S-adenosylmethionine:tRNA ribosyltransferase-isomerase